MSEKCEKPDEASPAEGGTAQGDPMALTGVEAAIFGLAASCPVTLLSTKAVDALCGADRSVRVDDTERILRSNVRLGYGIMLAGLFCPVFWISYLTGATGDVLLWHGVASGLIALAGLSLAWWNRHQLGRLRRTARIADR
jgi:hypothetical protein